MLARAVLLVPKRLVAQDRVPIRAQLQRPAASPGLRAGGEEELQFRLGHHDGPDVPPLRDPVAPAHERALLVHQGRSDRGVGGHMRCGLRNLGRPDRLRHVTAGDRDPLSQGDLDPARLRRGLAAVFDRQQCNGAVHRPRIEVGEAQRRRSGARNSALAGARGPVDGNDHSQRLDG